MWKVKDISVLYCMNRIHLLVSHYSAGSMELNQKRLLKAESKEMTQL